MRKWIPPLMIAGAFAISALVYDRLPPHAVLEFGRLLPFTPPAAPEPAPRIVVAIGLPLVALFVWLLLHEAPVSALGRMSARLLASRGGPDTASIDRDYARHAPTYRLIVVWVVALVLALHAALLASVLSWPLEPGRLVGLVFAAGLLVVGNALPRLRPNVVAGIRTARTMRDPVLWATVHRRAGAQWLAGGVVVLLVALLAPRWAFVAGVATLLLTALAMLRTPRASTLA